jgi:branched-chain amino acid transport system ATP-binding protein
MSAFSLDGVSKRFGGVQVLTDVSLDIAPAEVLGLIGPNGAGKTTLFNISCGLLQPDTGVVRLDGDDVTRLQPEARARRGLARTFQRLEVFRVLTVRENVQVAVDIRRGWKRAAPGVSIDEVLERVGIGHVADKVAGSLPTGTARLVEVARALATSPRVLLLDEPASGLDEAETERLGELVLELAADGHAVLLVEHDIAMVMRVSSRVVVLDNGTIIANGSPAEVRADPLVQEAYLGPAVEPTGDVLGEVLA